MVARKGLLAPQNTFLDTIAARFDGTRKWKYSRFHKKMQQFKNPLLRGEGDFVAPFAVNNTPINIS